VNEKMHKYNEKKVKKKDLKPGEAVPGTGITTKKKEQKH
jgi:hypothetical protein